ncbi:MAG: hypothetical protein LBB72_09790 [Spirochaetaceae bacterium]|nr:hypothetical protein [Spirochaetaceae bacterium]
MKKTLLATALALLGALAFSQERIAVFPFEDIDDILTRNESVFFYRRFSNEFANKNNGRFTIVPRLEVDKLIDTEAKFQLSNYSSKAKTAEMERVLNGTRILSGYIGKRGSKITISICLYTFPDLEQLPGGVDLDVADKDELFDKIPELVQKMQQSMQSALPPPPPPKPQKTKRTWTTRGTIFEDYTIYNALSIFGYTYSPGIPLGFSLGFYGVYTSLGFALPNWGRYSKIGSNDTPPPPNFSSTPYTDQRYEIIDWVLGYNVTIIPKKLYLPIGFGIENVKEWRLQNTDDYGNSGWNSAPQWETSILLEAGLLLRPTNKIEFSRYLTFSPYIYGTYRYIMPDKQSFSIGCGISFEKQ